MRAAASSSRSTRARSSALAERLAAERIESVAIGFLHSFTNPAHEKRTRDILAARLPGVTFTLSSEVSPEMREYERFSTACANAYVQPMIGRYLANLERAAAQRGFRLPALPDAVGRRADDGRDGDPLPGAAGRERPRRRRHLRQPHRAAMRPRQGAVLRHGRHHRQDLPDRRFAAADQPRLRGGAHLPLQEGQRPAAAHPGHRDGRDRRRRRLDRAGRPAEAHHRRPGQRRRRSRPGLLRPRRRRADRDRRRSAARPHRPDRVFRRPHGARPRRRRGGGRARGRRRRSISRCRSPPSGSARSSTRTWPTPPASTPSRAARTRAAAPSSRSAARRRCMPRGWPTSSASTGCWCRPTPGSARPSGFCARRSPTRSCARNCSGSTPSMPMPPTRCSRRCATEAEAIVRRGEPRGAARPRPARPSCATAARATRSPCRCRPAPIAPRMPPSCSRPSRPPIAGSTAGSSRGSRSRC